MGHVLARNGERGGTLVKVQILDGVTLFIIDCNDNLVAEMLLELSLLLRRVGCLLVVSAAHDIQQAPLSLDLGLEINGKAKGARYIWVSGGFVQAEFACKGSKDMHS